MFPCSFLTLLMLFMSFFWLVRTRACQSYFVLKEPALKFPNTLYCSLCFISLISAVIFINFAIYWVLFGLFLHFWIFEDSSLNHLSVLFFFFNVVTQNWKSATSNWFHHVQEFCSHFYLVPGNICFLIFFLDFPFDPFVIQ